MRNEADATEVKITFCNRAYARKWFKNLERYNPSHFMVLQAIISEIEAKDGGDIIKADIYKRNPEIEQQINSIHFDIIPSRGQMLRHNGNGIRHAKYSPSRSIAIVWEKIGRTVFITFDDHAPVRYHRAISHLRDIKLGRPVLPKRARNTGHFFRKLRAYWKYRYRKELKGVNLKHRYYE